MSLLFITVNDFIGEINLDLSNDANVLAQFEALGRQHEIDILKDLLGHKLYSDLIADLDSSEQPQTQKFIELVDGKTHILSSGETKIYEGLKRMLSYFVYSFYLEKNWSNNVSTGQTTNNNENSTPINRADLRKVRSTIHNPGVKLYNDAAKFIDDNYLDYFPNLNDYNFWMPKVKRYIGKITTGTPMNRYFYKRSSEGN